MIDSTDIHPDSIHHFAEQSKSKLTDYLHEIAADQPHRTPLIYLVKMVKDRNSAQLLFESLQTNDFLDPERAGSSAEREDRYAWDLLLYAVNDWALLAMHGEYTGDDPLAARAHHLIACAQHSDFNSEMRRSKDALAGIDRDRISDENATLRQLIESFVDRYNSGTEDPLIKRHVAPLLNEMAMTIGASLVEFDDPDELASLAKVFVVSRDGYPLTVCTTFDDALQITDHDSKATTTPVDLVDDGNPVARHLV